MQKTLTAPAGRAALLAFPALVPAQELVRVRPAHKVTVPPPALSEVAEPWAGHVRATVMSFLNIHEHGDLLVNFLRARKRTFIDRLHWNLPQVEGMEFDQYDTPLCRWVVIHEYGEVMAGIRLTPTTARCGIYSYMLRDAQLGLLEGIPRDVLFFDAPVSQTIWEASRLFIADEVPAHRRLQVQSILMANMSTAARDSGASQVIGIVPAVFARWLRRLDLDAVPVGPKFSIDGSSSQAALFKCAR
jgi:acyl homoserine lactone synthase